ncbi:MAG: biopolymer transporter ExbD [Burkholderiales bacterium]|jgi:biopolymer transport protein ExbD|nr:biopolymer transporter ExbD [Burkholderiales bacterium]
MNLRGYRVPNEPEINFIPLIDVLLVILIFLMVSTTYQRIRELQITLPEASAKQVENRIQEINVGVDSEGNYVVNGQIFRFSTAEDFAQLLRDAAGDTPDPIVVINADASATHQSVIRVMEAARFANIAHLTFATNEPIPR